MKSCIIFDLDNCLADDGWRIRLIDHSLPGEQAWAAYHAECGNDEPGHVGVLRATLQLRPDLVVVFITGRPESARAATSDWLKRHAPFLRGYLLLMRPGTSHGSVRMKQLHLLRLIDEGLYPICAFDDRQDIVDMYNQHGVMGVRLAVHDDMSPHRDIEPPAPQFAPMPLDDGDIASLAQLRPKKASPRPAQTVTAADILQAAADTFRERNAGYRDNYKMVAPIVRALFPAGVPPELVLDDRWHLFELAIVKLTRFAVSGLDHNDSARDAAVYLAMIEAINQSKGINQ